MEFLKKGTVFFRGEAIGTNYIFDCDIEIFVDEWGEIADVSGCGSETAKKLLNKI